MSTRTLLAQAKPKVYSVETSLGTLHVRSLTGAGRAKYMSLVRKHEPDAPPSHAIAALGLCYEDGKIEFDVDNEKDMAELGSMEGEDLQKIALKIFEVSGLAAKAVEEAEKNS